MRLPQHWCRTAPGFFLALALAVPAMAQAADSAGKVTLITGRGTASSHARGIRALAKNDPVFSGDIVHSSANSYVDLNFSDGGYFLLRPNTRFEVVEYTDNSSPPPAAPSPAAKPPTAVAAAPAPAPAAPAAQAAATPPAPVAEAAPAEAAQPLVSAQPAAQAGPSRAFFSLLKGGFRSVSGLIGKLNPDEYRVATPVATIGIRGTDYLVVVCDANCATDPQVLAALPPGVSPMGGIVATVYEHTIIIDDAGGEVNLKEGEYLLVLPKGVNIKLPVEPHFLHIDPTPNPKTCSG
jgi:hypothetical protein